ncbi:MAG: TonB-dependent receptor [Chitinophagaceae bacterium]
MSHNHYFTTLRNLIPITVIFGCNTLGISQTLSGNIRDSANHPIDLVTVTLFQNNQIRENTLTDSTGYFHFHHLPPDRYIVRFSRVGFTLMDTTLTLADSMQLIIRIAAISEILMQQVTVTSSKPLIERKIDRLVFNVENSLTSAGLDAFDLLGRSPGVTADNGIIRMIGRGSVALMINDRILRMDQQSLIAYLKSIRSESVVRIEIITNPPSKYEAEGGAGLINIVLKRDSRIGYNGNVVTSMSQSTHPTGNTGMSLNYNRSSIQSFITLSSMYGSFAPYTNADYFFPSGAAWAQVNLRREFSESISGLLGLEWGITKSSSLGFSINGSRGTPNRSETTNLQVFNNSGKLDSVLTTSGKVKSVGLSTATNVHFKTALDTLGKTISVDFDWFANDGDRSTLFLVQNFLPGNIPSNFPPTNFLSKTPGQSSVYSLSLDFVFPRFWGWHLTTGHKSTWISNANSVALYTRTTNDYELNHAVSNTFNFDERTQAVYASMRRKLHTRFTVQLGLRAELTKTRGFSVEMDTAFLNDYFQVFPSTYLMYEPNNTNTFSLSYSRRITRPPLNYLNPYRIYYSPFLYAEGNPNLRQYFNNNLELSHTYKKRLSSSLAFSYSNNEPGSFAFADPSTTIQTLSVKNYLERTQVYLSTNVTFQKWNRLESVNSIEGFYASGKSSEPATLRRVRGFGGVISTRNSVTMDAKKLIVVSMDVIFQFPETSGITQYRSYFFIDAAFRATMLKRKLLLVINIRDPLRSRVIKSERLVNNVLQVYTSNNDSRRIALTVRYNFGSTKFKAGRSYFNSQTDQLRVKE